MFRGLRAQLTLIFVGLAILPVIIVSIFITQNSVTTLESQAVSSQREIARRVSAEIGAEVENSQSSLSALTELQDLLAFNAEEQVALLGNFLSVNRTFQSVALLNADGTASLVVRRDTAITGDIVPDYYSATELENMLQAARQGDIYYTPIGFEVFTREPITQLSIPIFDNRTGELARVLVGGYRFRTIWDLLGDIQLEDEQQSVFVVDNAGTVFAHDDPSIVLANRHYPPPKGGRTDGLEGNDVITSSSTFHYGNQSLTVVAEIPADIALSLTQDTVRIGLVTTGVALIVAAVLVILTVRQIVRPIQVMASTASEISGGNLESRVQVRRKDEIGQLATAFNSMTDQLQEFIRGLEDRVRARTRDMQVAAEVSKSVATILNLETLLPQFVVRTKQQFDLYYVSVFLYDQTREVLRLESGTGVAGERMKAKDKQFSINDQGVVPQAARVQEPVIENDVSQSAMHFVNELLPNTRAELAIPMIVGDRLVGVLDLQAEEKDYFSIDDVRVMNNLADQISIAIENARLFADAEEARQAAEEANRIKSQFLANMSHELRTPLNAILNFTAFVADGVLGPVNDEQVETLQQSIASGKHLLSLINDILDITKIEAGLMDLFIQQVDMNEVLASIVSVGKGLVKEKPINLVTTIEDNLPTTYGDKRRLRQVFLNIVSNAVKFTPTGSITISALLKNSTILVSVTDTGIGIAPEDQSLVFESFKQAKHDLQEAIGTGLGMPISKYFVETHQGRIWLESDVGVGTTVYVELPILTEEQAAEISSQILQRV